MKRLSGVVIALATLTMLVADADACRRRCCQLLQYEPLRWLLESLRPRHDDAYSRW